jgi:twinkle protein
MIDLLECSDTEFEFEWRSLEQDERDALPDDVRSASVERFRRLTGYIGASIERLRHEQARAPNVVELDDQQPKIEDATHYLPEVQALWRAGLPPGDKTGWPSVDRHYTVAPGQMTIITGWPGAGKSEWLDHLLVNLTHQSWKFAIFSAENQPVEIHIAKLLEKVSGKPFGAGPTERLAENELPEYCFELCKSFRFISPQQDALSLRKVIAAASTFLLADDGRKAGLIIDPWNELEHSRPRHVSETEYISGSLSYLRNWARVSGVHVWLVAHPAKQPRDDGKLPIPTPDMISGSQHWWNKADCAITVYRDLQDLESRETSIVVQKIRFKHIGTPGSVTLRYDRVTGRYSETSVAYKRQREPE